MFTSHNNQLLHKEAVDLVIKALPSAVSMDAIAGAKSTYHVNWNGIKILVKVARPSLKTSQKRAKWFYALRAKDHQSSNFFVLLCLIDSSLEAVYAIPRVFLPKSYITITRLDGNMRYDYFRTTIQDLPNKIMEIQVNIPKLSKLLRQSKEL